MVDEPLIRLLGTPSSGWHSDGAFFPSKGFQLLAVLACSHGGRASRKELADLLWESGSDGVVLANLRQLIARMKKALPLEDLLEVNAYSVALGAQREEVDICRLGLTLEGSASALMLALPLLRGELLDGVGDVSDLFSHWLMRERAAFRERIFLSAQAALVELTKYGRASEKDLKLIAEKLFMLEPEREQSYRALIEAYGRNGMFEEARRLFDLLCIMLETEHGTGPSPETLAVTRRVFAPRQNYGHIPTPSPVTDDRPRIAFLAPERADGVTTSDLLKFLVDDVTNELARHRNFLVLSPHSSFKINHHSGIPVDNSVLRADYTISGFVKPDRDGKILALRMISSASLEVIWAAEFPIDPEALLKCFGLLCRRIASSLSCAIETDRMTALRVGGDASSYLRYLEGQKSLVSCDLPSLRRARKSFKQSIDLNPGFAPARARVAQTLYLEWIQLGGQDPNLLNVAREQSEIAIALDPNDAIGHWMKGTVALYQRDFDECEAKLAEAETLCPYSADLLVQHADALSHLGDPDRGWGKFNEAINLNPLPPDHYWWAGASIAFRRQSFEKTIELCGKLADDEPVLPVLAASHALLGQIGQARVYGQRLKELFPNGMALEKSKLVTPDRSPIHRHMSIEGLRLAGAL